MFDQMIEDLGKQALRFLNIKKHEFRLLPCCLLIGIMVHGYMFTNMLLNHDEILYEYGQSYNIYGRYLLSPIIELFFKDYRMPLMIGICAILLLSGVCIGIISFLEIKSKIISIFIIAVIMTYPSLTSTFCYYILLVPYLSALLCVVMGCILVSQNKSIDIVAGILLWVISLAVYQAYICFAVGLLFIYVFILVIQNNDLKDCSVMIWKWIISLFTSFFLYFLCLRLVLRVSHSSLSSYQGIDRFNIDSIISSLKGILCAYKQTVLWFLNVDYTLNISNASFFVIGAHVVILIISLYIVFKYWFKLDLKNKCLLCLLMLLSPCAMEAIHIIGGAADSVHMVMRMGTVLWYILALKLIDIFCFNKSIYTKKIKTCLAIGCAAFLGISYHNCLIANEVYLRQQLAYERAYSQAVRISYDLQQIDGFSPSSKVFINDTLFNENYYNDTSLFGNIGKLTGVTTQENICSSYLHIQHFFQRYLNIQFELPTINECREIVRTKEFEEMPLYPEKGSIKIVNDVIVIKMNPWGTLAIWQ